MLSFVIKIFLHYILCSCSIQTIEDTENLKIAKSMWVGNQKQKTVYAKTFLIGTLECYQQSTAIDVHARYSQLGWSMNIIICACLVKLTVIEALYVMSHHRSIRLQVHFLRFCAVISEHKQGLTGWLRQGTDLWDGMFM